MQNGRLRCWAAAWLVCASVGCGAGADAPDGEGTPIGFAGASAGGVSGGAGGSAGSGGVAGTTSSVGGAGGVGGASAGSGGASGSSGAGGAAGAAGSGGASGAGGSGGASGASGAGGSAGSAGSGGASGSGGAGGAGGTTGGTAASDPMPHDSCSSASHDGRTYWFCTDNQDWDDARVLCQAIGGDLVSLNDQAEQDFVAAEAGGGEWLIGLNQKNASGSSTDGTWAWVDGTDVTGFAVWGSGEPDSADCGELYNGSWRDLSCTNDENWICEMP